MSETNESGSNALARLAELEAKATKGPWVSRTDLGAPWERDIYAGSPNVAITEPNGFKRLDDAIFIAAARNTMPALLALAEEAMAARRKIDGADTIGDDSRHIDWFNRRQQSDSALAALSERST